MLLQQPSFRMAVFLGGFTMATQMLYAREGKITDQMKIAAEREHMEPEKLRQLIASGRAARKSYLRAISFSRTSEEWSLL